MFTAKKFHICRLFTNFGTGYYIHEFSIIRIACMNNSGIFLAVLVFILSSCNSERSMKELIDDSLGVSVKHYSAMFETLNGMPDRLPRTLDEEGNLVHSDSRWWTSGFFPGSLWYLYEYSGNEEWKKKAQLMTSRVEREKYTTSNHDVGFMLYCSFGNGLRIVGEDRYKEVLLTGARSLCTRFRPLTGCIQSWKSNSKWQCPVIIDNMMNLELLMWAFKESGDSAFYKIAVSHADMTMKHHFRADYSTYHVVSFDTITGTVEARQTHQGAADESAWSRGQSWGLYGYTMMYRETGLERYLTQAKNIAGFLINHPSLPEDKIPYWDFNAPDIPDARRDASAGAIMASALLELSGYVDPESSKKYMGVAEKQIRTLASPLYLATPGTNGNFILMHSIGSLPGKSEVDVPLTYADYYFIEALIRFRKLL